MKAQKDVDKKESCGGNEFAEDTPITYDRSGEIVREEGARSHPLGCYQIDGDAVESNSSKYMRVTRSDVSNSIYLSVSPTSMLLLGYTTTPRQLLVSSVLSR